MTDVPSRLSIGLLGPPVVLVDDVPVSVDTRKAIALLAYLCERETAAPRDELAWLLWPDSTGDRARGALRRTISSLRRALGGRWVEADRDRVRFDRHDAEVDTSLLGRPGGVDRVRGRFLDGFTLRDAPDFDDWQATTAQHYDRIIRAELERQALDLLESGDPAGAIGSAERRLSFDPLDESSHRLLMTALARSGDRAAAIQQYRACVAVLEEELAVDPLPETVDVYERILAGELSPAPVHHAPAVGARPRIEDPGFSATTEQIRIRASLPGVLRVGGPPSSGRSTVVASALPRAVRVTAYPSDVDLPHSLSRSILAALAARNDAELDERAAPAAHVEPSLARRVDDVPDLEGDFASGRLLDGVTAAIGQLLGSDILIVDDADRADHASTLVLDRLADRARDVGIRLVYVTREADADIGMLPVGASAIEALVGDPELAQRIHEATGGWVGPSLDVAMSDDPDRSIAELRAGIVDDLGQLERQALEALVVLGSGRLGDISRVAGRPVDDIAPALDRLVSTGLVKSGDRHEPVGTWVVDAVMASMGGARTALLHGRAADTVPDRPEGAGARAVHLERAGRTDEAAAAHAEAARAAAALYAPEAVRRHAEAAIALGHRERRDLHLLLGVSETLAGAYDAAVTAYTSAAAEGTDWSLEQTIGDVYARWGRWELARGTLEAALDLADQDWARAAILADLAVVAIRSGRPEESRERIAEALEVLDDDAEVAARVRNVAGLVLDDPVHLQAAITRARRTGRREDEAAALNNLAVAYGRAGRHGEAISMAERALGLLDRTGDRHRRAAVLGNLADLHHAAGDDERSNEMLRQAVGLFAEVGVARWEPEIWKLTGW